MHVTESGSGAPHIVGNRRIITLLRTDRARGATSRSLVAWGLAGGAALAALAFAEPAAGQRIDPSPRGSWEQDVSGTAISVDYSRPSVRGRTTFGDQVAFGEFWTPGANRVTKIRFSRDVTLQGRELAAGAYGLWVEASEDSEIWRAMLTADTTLWHYPHLTEDDGFLVMDVPHEVVDVHQETLEISLDSIRTQSALLQMHWGNDRISLSVGIDLGVTFTVTPEEAATYVGTWTRKMAPLTEEELARRRANAEENGSLDDFNDRYQRQLDEASEWEIELLESGHLVVDDGGAPDFYTLLVPRGDGFFLSGYLFQGEPAFFDPTEGNVIEFLTGDDGTAVEAEERDADGVLRYRLTRGGVAAPAASIDPVEVMRAGVD